MQDNIYVCISEPLINTKKKTNYLKLFPHNIKKCICFLLMLLRKAMHSLIVATFFSDRRSPLTASMRIWYLRSVKSKKTVHQIQQKLPIFWVCFKQVHKKNKDPNLDFFLVPRLAAKSLLDEDWEVVAKGAVAVEPKDQVHWSIQRSSYLNVDQDIIPVIVNTTTEVI